MGGGLDEPLVIGGVGGGRVGEWVHGTCAGGVLGVYEETARVWTARVRGSPCVKRERYIPSPVQRAAAHYGIRNLRWPYPWSDQPPPYAWQYDPSRQPLLELDDEMEVRMNAVRRRRNRQRQLDGNGAGGGGGSGSKRGVAAGKAGGGDGGGGGDDGVYGNMEVVMPAVLPYW